MLTKEPWVVWLLLDGKAGHENQSRGLADALCRHSAEVNIYEITLPTSAGIWASWQAANQQAQNLPKPQWVIAAGHRTHLILLLLCKRYQCQSILLMRPSLPCSWFDYVIVPEHDLRNQAEKPNVITTQGVLHRIIPHPNIEKKLHVILIGGPSKTHGFDLKQLMSQIQSIRDQPLKGDWVIADSRRTPECFQQECHRLFPDVLYVSHLNTTKPLSDYLNQAQSIWVTEDSVSMVYESLATGAAVGLIEMPKLKSSYSRVLKGILKLKQQGYFINHPGDASNKRFLLEAERIAKRLMEIK